MKATVFKDVDFTISNGSKGHLFTDAFLKSRDMSSDISDTCTMLSSFFGRLYCLIWFCVICRINFHLSPGSWFSNPLFYENIASVVPGLSVSNSWKEKKIVPSTAQARTLLTQSICRCKLRTTSLDTGVMTLKRGSVPCTSATLNLLFMS